MTSFPTLPAFSYVESAVAYVDLDLIILRTNQAFQELVAAQGDIRGNSIGDLLESSQIDVLQRLRNELRAERDVREPAYMAPINVGGDQQAVQSVAESELERVTQGFTDRALPMTFRTIGGRHTTLQVRVRLAKTTRYFAVLAVPSQDGFRIAAPLFRAPPPASRPPAPQLPPPAPYTPQLREFGRQPSVSAGRDSPLGASAPPSPFTSFQGLQTTLPNPSMAPPAPTASPAYTYASMAAYSPASSYGTEYFQSYQQTPTSGGPPTPYATSSRPPSSGSEAFEVPRSYSRPESFGPVQLPPLRPAPTSQPIEAIERPPTAERRPRERVSPEEEEESRRSTEGKRRRMNVRDIMDPHD